MDNNIFPDNHTRDGTIGGTLLVVLLQVRFDDIIKTAVLAGVGALASFSISLLLRLFVRWLRKYR